MKHLSIWLTVLLLGGVAPTAAALDYGSNSILLAADASAPQLPGATRSETAGAMTVDAGDNDGGGDAGEGAALAAERSTRSAAVSHDAGARSPGPPASGKPHPSAGRQSPAPAAASWQSLLPGSIQ